MAQQIKNPPATQETQETWVRSLGWEDTLEKEMATRSSILAWRIPMDGGAWWATVHGVPKSWTRLRDEAQHSTGSPQSNPFLCCLFLWPFLLRDL